MRTIKFRGKSKRTGEWVYGDLLRNVEGAFAIVPPFELNSHNECSNYEVEEATIGQFTNLYDKNIKEIYENDILKMACADGTVEYYRVVWHKAGFYLDMRQYGYVPLGNIDRELIEVVGNIYETPELLKGGNK